MGLESSERHLIDTSKTDRSRFMWMEIFNLRFQSQFCSYIVKLAYNLSSYNYAMQCC